MSSKRSSPSPSPARAAKRSRREADEKDAEYEPDLDSGEDETEAGAGLVQEPAVDMPDSNDELVRQATEIIEGTVLKTAKAITDDLHAPYDSSLYSEVFYHLGAKEVAALNIGMYLDRNVVVSIIVQGRHFGNIKVPFLFRSSSGRPMLALEIKTKKTQLKETDLDNLRCAVEQLAKQRAIQRGAPDEEKLEDRPRAMVLNFSQGETSSMVMQRDGTVSA